MYRRKRRAVVDESTFASITGTPGLFNLYVWAA
jgi:hypothetical protein